MRTIKRYPNRKLYDTVEKQYITLDGIAEFIRTGQDIQVTDYASGEDLTTLTLSQIILEQEKKQSGFLPHSVLSSLIQAGGASLAALQRGLANSLGVPRQIDEEIKRRIQTLIAAGEVSATEGDGLLQKLLAPKPAPDQAEEAAERDTSPGEVSSLLLEKFLQARHIPTRHDLTALQARLDELTATLCALEQARSAPPSNDEAQA
jgi:polyhydroxyalkanoate synthesis repressor PhaR